VTIQTVNKDDLMALGLTQGTAQKVIKVGKEKLIERGFPIYGNRAIQVLPVKIASEILGFEINLNGKK